ncbi:hypothetical protein M2459_000005 [Parabacteroides sp. PF5-5]|nr:MULTISPECIES: hypothetical protein [unclassified Parabacteroides]MDH6303673.1 hypothetical protein [Parabacteroides sp. PH5-39]MDH6314290.1 hypothetical protein [Parabacteroides sp. PF5-13]MDH6318646.1 hypothetical protein [Parabacteroides sp. PH5-13]MDH6322062.1 hypothetical protein [Parabacteroides sp. PH5-8]MDH6325859.1 hypothetical protein [Parabacteroides sp. PH5-41]
MGRCFPKQIIENAEASTLPPFSDEEMTIVRKVYDKYIRKQIHDNW